MACNPCNTETRNACSLICNPCNPCDCSMSRDSLRSSLRGHTSRKLSSRSSHSKTCPPSSHLGSGPSYARNNNKRSCVCETVFAHIWWQFMGCLQATDAIGHASTTNSLVMSRMRDSRGREIHQNQNRKMSWFSLAIELFGQDSTGRSAGHAFCPFMLEVDLPLPTFGSVWTACWVHFWDFKLFLDVYGSYSS